jgi:hypothetical protein
MYSSDTDIMMKNGGYASDIMEKVGVAILDGILSHFRQREKASTELWLTGATFLFLQSHL